MQAARTMAVARRLLAAAVLGALGLLAGGAAASADMPGAWPGPHVYNDAYTGWPVAPVDVQHPLRASFQDPRPGSFPTGPPGYHIGLDIAVRDDQPEPGAPPGRSHRVYAVEGGVAELLPNVANVGCVNRRVRVGHFSYWHVDPVGVVANGQAIAPGQLIGWTCATLWHVHLSEIQTVAGIEEWVNPLHPGGKLAPYVDSAPPEVQDLSLYAPAEPAWALVGTALVSPEGGVRLDPAAVAGPIDLRATIPDRQSFTGWLSDLPALVTDLHPYRVHVTLTRLVDGAVVWDADAFQSDTYLTLPFGSHYAPGARQNLPAKQCLDSQPAPCAGTFRLRLLATPASPYLDTTTLGNGAYRFTVTALDTAGNASPPATLDLTVANATAPAVPPATPPTAPTALAPAPDTRAPRVSVRLASDARLASAARTGIGVRVRCDEPCRVSVALRAGPRAARGLGIPATRNLALGTVSLVRPGVRTVRLVLTPAARRLLRGRAQLDGVLRTAARDTAGNGVQATRRVVLRR